MCEATRSCVANCVKVSSWWISYNVNTVGSIYVPIVVKLANYFSDLLEKLLSICDVVNNATYKSANAKNVLQN